MDGYWMAVRDELLGKIKTPPGTLLAAVSLTILTLGMYAAYVEAQDLKIPRCTPSAPASSTRECKLGDTGMTIGRSPLKVR